MLFKAFWSGKGQTQVFFDKILQKVHQKCWCKGAFGAQAVQGQKWPKNWPV